MNPSKVDRANLRTLTDLPNIGKAMADDLRLLGYRMPADVAGASPFEMYRRLCAKTGTRHDPCVLDVFISVTESLKGGAARPWWELTEIRKKSGPLG